jgi:hypothetical protein
MSVSLQTIVRIKEIVKPTEAQFFRDIKVGNTLRLQIRLEHYRHGFSGLYPTDVECTVLETMATRTITMNNLCNRLGSFIIEECVVHLPKRSNT